MQEIRFNIIQKFKQIPIKLHASLIVNILYLSFLTIFLIDEINLNIRCSYFEYNALFCLMEIIIFLVFTKQQIVGSWLIILTSWIGLIPPLQTSATLVFNCLLAVTLLGYHNLLQGIGASLTYFITHSASAYMAQATINTTDSLLTFMTLGVFCLTGLSLRWLQLKTESDNRLVKDRHQQQIAISLHDKTCNNLAYSIRFIDEHLCLNSQVSETDLTELQNVLRETLTQTRTVISQLIDDASSDHTQQVNDSDQLRHLNQIISQAQHRLDELQFKGEIINAIQELNHFSKKKAELLFDVTNELFSDIIKHADPVQGYLITFGTSGNNISISVCDVPRRNPTDPAIDKPTTMGLLRYKAILEASGGSITIRSTKHLWMTDITIPSTGTEPAPLVQFSAENPPRTHRHCT